MKSYNLFARALIRLWRAVHPGWSFRCEEKAEGPVVYVVHHQNMRGPVHALALLPGQPRLWALAPFLERKTCWRHFYGYTFTRRYGWPKAAAALAAGFLSLVAPPTLRAFGMVPVHRDASAIRTLRASCAALRRGESLIICPDVDYSDDSAQMATLYTGFLALERLYYKGTGRHLEFVPLCCRKGARTLQAGQPVRFEDGDFAAQAPDVAARLRRAINTMAGQDAAETAFAPGTIYGAPYPYAGKP